MTKKIILVFILFLFIILISPYIFFIFAMASMGSRNLLESVESPNGKYVINTYLNNCGATCDFGITAELCDLDNNCKEIYNVYHERTSFVYWLDDEHVFINYKVLNVFKDNYHRMN